MKNTLLDVKVELHCQKYKELEKLETELDTVISNTEVCWDFLYKHIYNKYTQKLTAPNIDVILTEKPLRVHLYWDKDISLFFEIRSHEEIYVQSMYKKDVLTGWRNYLNLSKLVIFKELEDALLLFTEEAQ